MNIMGSHGAAAAAAAAANNNNPSVDYLLSRQGSLYSLTLDEFQTQLGNHLGKPLSTMNLDELLRTVWIAESNSENNGSSSSAATVPPNHSIRLMPSSGSPPPSLHAQSSNHSLLPHDLCTKTVDQVWREINKKGNKTSNDTPGCDAGERSSEDRQQQTLGEMTLEDFLAQAGVISEVGANANCGGSGLMGIVVEPNAAQQHCQWIQYPAAAITQQQFMPSGGHQVGGGGQKAAAANTNLIMDSANLSDTAPLSPPSFILEVLSDTQAPVPLRKRVASKEVMVERTVERRQKRMIKNRESAARSRARKQAYTNELENKVSRLEEENKRLRRMKEVEKVLPSLPPPEPKCQLRRTNSGPL